MFILIQEHEGKRVGDTMVLDSVAGHRRTYEALAGFLASSRASHEIAATPGRCHLCPELPTLRALRMVKSDGFLMTRELPEGVLQVSGRPDLLARYIEDFRYAPGDAECHRHPDHYFAFRNEVERGSNFIIIEVDEYADDPERWAADNREDFAG